MVADILFIGLLIFAAVCDVRTRLIENWTVLAILALAIGKLLYQPSEFLSLILAFLSALPLLFLWLKGGLGGGDVKLIAASLCYLGIGRLLPFWVIFMLGLVGLMLLCAVRNKRTMPLAPAIALAGTGALFIPELF